MDTDHTPPAPTDNPQGQPFCIVPDWLIEQASGTACRVWCALWRHANRRTGRCDPYRQTIADLLRISVKTFDRSVAELETLGALTVEAQQRSDGGTRANQYVLRFTPLVKNVQGGRHQRPGGASSMSPPLEPEEQNQSTSRSGPASREVTPVPKGSQIHRTEQDIRREERQSGKRTRPAKPAPSVDPLAGVQPLEVHF
jgi:hypothetical protein